MTVSELHAEYDWLARQMSHNQAVVAISRRCGIPAHEVESLLDCLP